MNFMLNFLYWAMQSFKLGSTYIHPPNIALFFIERDFIVMSWMQSIVSSIHRVLLYSSYVSIQFPFCVLDLLNYLLTITINEAAPCRSALGPINYSLHLLTYTHLLQTYLSTIIILKQLRNILISYSKEPLLIQLLAYLKKCFNLKKINQLCSRNIG